MNSPNFGARRGGLTPRLILVHYTAMESCDAARERLCSPEYEVSAHYLISEQGGVEALVAEEMRAWHAGAGVWGACRDINSASIGIELANTGAQPFSEPQMRALENLLGGIMQRWKMGPEAVLGHSDIAPSRKIDPGRRFDWRRLALQGLSVWPEETSAGALADEPAFLNALHGFGYNSEEPLEVLLAAYRLRFAPWRSGALSEADVAGAQSLAARFAVDPALAKP